MVTARQPKAGLPPLPRRMAHLPLDERGYPVPAFVQWAEGMPDFRIMDSDHLRACVKLGLCWVCGGQLGSFKAYVIGPMCVVNRISSEPPSHRECAEYSARACPFLVHPKMKRIEGDMPEGATMAGIPCTRNPGVAVVWVTRSPLQLLSGKQGSFGNDGILFNVGDPHAVMWFARGRPATVAEAVDSINSGLPTLRDIAEAQGETAALDKAVDAALWLLPEPEWLQGDA